jgi:predicted amidophosphoribosyltransferase
MEAYIIPFLKAEFAANDAASDILTSENLAQFLRIGPARAMLDRLVRSAAETSELEFMCLGLRSEGKYYFISSYGFPFTSHVDHVPTYKMKTSLFSRAVEVEDLSKEPNFAALATIPVAKLWKYGANVPIRLVTELADGGILALSGADRKTRKPDGKTLQAMRLIADLISDSIWLMTQVHSATADSHKSTAATRVLLDGLRQTMAPIALVDEALNLIDFSPGYVDCQKYFVGSVPKRGETIEDILIDPDAGTAIKLALRNNQHILAMQAKPDGSHLPLVFDFHILTFPDANMRVGVFSIHAKSMDRTWQIASGFIPGDAAMDEPNSAAKAENAPVVSRFLLETLLKKPRLLQRKSQPYLALRTWRKPIKQYQISAIKALKSDVPEAFVAQISDELAKGVQSVYGATKDAVVVAVPCGHSGQNCLSHQIAAALALRLGVPHVAAFEPLKLTGSSHPKTNAKRPKMKLTAPVEQRVILVDDIATSGAHIEEAAKLLQKSAKAVWPIVWIAD